MPRPRSPTSWSPRGARGPWPTCDGRSVGPIVVWRHIFCCIRAVSIVTHHPFVPQSFDDIHKLWFVLYKECNMLLSEREKARRNQRPVLAVEEQRYTKVKRSMAAIKVVLGERQRINDLLKRQTPS